MKQSDDVYRSATRREIPVGNYRTPRNQGLLVGALLYRKKGAFDIYIREGRVLVNVTEYHPELLELQISDLEDLIGQLKHEPEE